MHLLWIFPFLGNPCIFCGFSPGFSRESMHFLWISQVSRESMQLSVDFPSFSESMQFSWIFPGFSGDSMRCLWIQVSWESMHCLWESMHCLWIQVFLGIHASSVDFPRVSLGT